MEHFSRTDRHIQMVRNLCREALSVLDREGPERIVTVILDKSQGLNGARERALLLPGGRNRLRNEVGTLSLCLKNKEPGRARRPVWLEKGEHHEEGGRTRWCGPLLP